MAGSPRYFVSFPWQFVSESIYDHLYSKLKRSVSGVQWLSLEPGLLGLESNVLTAKSMRLHKQSFFFSFFFNISVRIVKVWRHKRRRFWNWNMPKKEPSNFKIIITA